MSTNTEERAVPSCAEIAEAWRSEQPAHESLSSFDWYCAGALRFAGWGMRAADTATPEIVASDDFRTWTEGAPPVLKGAICPRCQHKFALDWPVREIKCPACQYERSALQDPRSRESATSRRIYATCNSGVGEYTVVLGFASLADAQAAHKEIVSADLERLEALAVEQQQGTPSSRWATTGEPDPHGTRYDCERADLAMGKLTDDELANGAFMNYDVRPSLGDILSGKAHFPIAWMTAVKDRIRWLSRSLEKAKRELKQKGDVS